jgi:DNA-binding phage protein
MVTPQQLAKLLRGVNVAEVAKVANVSTKTIYRLQQQANVPNMATVQRLLDAIKATKPARKRKPAQEAA